MPIHSRETLMRSTCSMTWKFFTHRVSTVQQDQRRCIYSSHMNMIAHTIHTIASPLRSNFQARMKFECDTHQLFKPSRENVSIGRKHPLRDVIFSGHNLAKKCNKQITSHDVLEPLKQVFSASRDVILSGQIWGSTDAGCPFYSQESDP